MAGYAAAVGARCVGNTSAGKHICPDTHTTHTIIQYKLYIHAVYQRHGMLVIPVCIKVYQKQARTAVLCN